MNATYISSNQFSVSTDRTSEFINGRRLKLDCDTDGIKYCTVATSSYSSPNTTVTTKESELTSNLITVLYGIIEPGVLGSLPDHIHDGSEGSGGSLILGATTFSGLSDTPLDYGTAGQYFKSTGSGTEWANNTFLISEDTILYITASGGSNTSGDGTLDNPYASIEGSVDYLKDKTIQVDKGVTIQYLDGTHTLSGTLGEGIYNHSCAAQIYVNGSTTYDYSITSVQSSSGSAGAYSITFNMTSVSGVEVGDYMLVTNDASNGTNPSYACGVHEITNVDEVNIRITVTSTHQSGVPSGLVTASVIIFKTIITYDNDIIHIDNNGFLRVGNIVFINSTTASNCVYVQNGGIIKCDNPCGFVGGNICLYSLRSGHIYANNCGASGGETSNCQSMYFSSIVFENSVSSGSVTQHGILTYYNSSILAGGTVSTGNAGHGFFTGYNSFTLNTNGTSTGNGQWGWYTNYNAGIRRTGTCVGGNNGSGDTSAVSGAYIQT